MGSISVETDIGLEQLLRPVISLPAEVMTMIGHYLQDKALKMWKRALLLSCKFRVLGCKRKQLPVHPFCTISIV